MQHTHLKSHPLKCLPKEQAKENQLRQATRRGGQLQTLREAVTEDTPHTDRNGLHTEKGQAPDTGTPGTKRTLM